ncbi:MAG: chromosomal replication initiator protein DnaA [Syntrophorhabdaceae bacterium]|nr:chromosomal replication initiator protein DnaA [Syntrophorhabdaceae bacterium]
MTIASSTKDWEKVLESLRNVVNEQVFETWLRPLRFVTREGSVLIIATPHKFFKQWIEDNHFDQIEEAAHKELGENVSIDIVVGEEEEPLLLPSSINSEQFIQPDATSTRTRNNNNDIALNLQYTFDRFVVGTGNQFAHAAASAVASSPGAAYNPLFIYGGVGLGKTHLLHAIGNEVMALNPRLNVCYIPAEKFTNELITCIRTNRMQEFKERYRNADVLLVDDVQFIAGKTRTQEEFFHTFNDLYSSRKQIVVSSDKFPKEIPDLEERIQSRFEWGLVADIQAPDIETRVAIVNHKAEAENIPLPEDVALYLASVVKSNVRELEGHLKRIGAHASLMNKEINLELAKSFLESISSPGKEITPDSIIKIVAEHYKLKISDLRSNRRPRLVSMPRQVAMYLVRKIALRSFPEIGSLFGGRDHTTVMYAVKKIDQRLSEDVSLRNTIETLRKKIEG